MTSAPDAPPQKNGIRVHRQKKRGKVAILGAGGMGSLIGAHIKKGGASVFFVDPYEAHMQKTQEEGLQIAVAGKEPETVRLDLATTDSRDAGVCDIVIVMVKGMYTKSICLANPALFGPDTVALTLQNGVGNADALREIMPAENIGFGVVKASASLDAPGMVSGTVPPVGDKTKYGIDFAALEGLKKYEEKYSKLAGYLNAGGFSARFSERAEEEVWIKLFTNVLFNLPCALTRLRMEGILSHPGGAELLKLLGREVIAVANAKGFALDFDACWAEVNGSVIGKPAGRHFPSAAQDVRKKKKTEVETLNGAIVREGRKLGIPTPYNEAVYLMAKALEDTYDQQF